MTKCPTGKARYANQAAADAKLEELRAAAKTNKRRRERSSYPCTAGCDGWHLTSKGVSPARPLAEIAAEREPIKAWDARALDDDDDAQANA